MFTISTSEKEQSNLVDNGYRFEYFLEQLFLKKGYRNVFRNVEYRRRIDGAKRQADIVYDIAEQGLVKRVLVEAKYTTLDVFPYALRKPLLKNGSDMQLTNVIDEVKERQEFIGADYAFLVTNSYFDWKVRENAKDIKLIDKPLLTHELRMINPRLSIDSLVKNTILGKKDYKRSIIHI